MRFAEIKDLHHAMTHIVPVVGEALLASTKEIFDTHDYKGHESSSLDDVARQLMQKTLDEFLPDFEGMVRLELRPYSIVFLEKREHHPLTLIIDEIEGTTNTKRCMASAFEYRPASLISMGLSFSESLKDLAVGAVYTLDRSEVFSAFKTDGHFLAFHDNKLIYEDEIIKTKGDSKRRILVIGYSNSHRTKKGQLEQALFDSGLKVYDGCRSSGMDIINIIRNNTDAYVDLRSFWSTKDADGHENEAMLQTYDVAGVIPIAEGCGLKVSDAEGNSWHNYELETPIPLIVSRPDIYEQIMKVVKPFAEKWKSPSA